MFNLVNGSCASDTTTALLNQATAGFANTFFRSSFNCTQEEPVWSTSADALDRSIFCGYKEVSTYPASACLRCACVNRSLCRSIIHGHEEVSASVADTDRMCVCVCLSVSVCFCFCVCFCVVHHCWCCGRITALSDPTKVSAYSAKSACVLYPCVATGVAAGATSIFCGHK